MATARLDTEALKQALKEALAEMLQEQRELCREVLAEVLEDFALAEAIREGLKTPKVSRAEVFELLGTPNENQLPQELHAGLRKNKEPCRSRRPSRSNRKRRDCG